MTELVRLSFSGIGSPMIGAEVRIGDPGGLAISRRVVGVGGVGILYKQVAARTTAEPRTKANVMG